MASGWRSGKTIQIRFGHSVQEAVDRVAGNVEYVKMVNALLLVGTKFPGACFPEFREAQLAKLREEYDNANSMLEHEEQILIPPRSPSPQAGLTDFFGL